MEIDIDCIICRDILVDPVALTCCGKVACLWCLDPSQVNNSTQRSFACKCPNCRQALHRATVCSTLKAFIEKQVGKEVLDAERQARKDGHALVISNREKGKLYLASSRYNLLLDLLRSCLKTNQTFISERELHVRVNGLLADIQMQTLMAGELELLLSNLDVWQRGNLLHCKCPDQWASLEEYLIIKKLELDHKWSEITAYAEYKAWPKEIVDELQKPRPTRHGFDQQVDIAGQFAGNLELIREQVCTDSSSGSSESESD